MRLVRSRTRLRLALLLGLGAMVVASAPSLAQDRRPPATSVHVGGVVKRLRPWSVDWVRRRGHHCVATHRNGIPTFEPRIRVGRRHVKAKVVFEKARKPRRVRAFAGRHLVAGNLAHPRRLDVRLRQRGSGRGRRWVAKMRVKVKRRAFVDVIAGWRDTEGCGGREGAAWSFRLVRR
jgi:hypothetical protein